MQKHYTRIVSFTITYALFTSYDFVTHMLSYNITGAQCNKCTYLYITVLSIYADIQLT